MAAFVQFIKKVQAALSGNAYPAQPGNSCENCGADAGEFDLCSACFY